MKLDQRIEIMRKTMLEAGNDPVPTAYQGVSKQKIAKVLSKIALDGNTDLVDGVFALLDDITPSWFSNAPNGATISSGASTAHLGCHIGILQRGQSKLDREGRDYWIKPLRDLAGIEAVFLNANTCEFIPGHPVAKSPNSAYRLSDEFKAILQAEDGEWQKLLTAWIEKDSIRHRKEFQARLAEQSKAIVDTKHSDLINASVEHYSPNFLPGYEVIYIDDGDGDRITDDDRELLNRAGITLQLGDAMPDVLLWNSDLDSLWVIEAVTSDGEVDLHKTRQLQNLAKRCGKSGVGFTTTYRSWKDAASRQSIHKNLAISTYLWIQDDPSKHFLVESFPEK